MLLFLLACGGDQTISSADDPPLVEILRPAEGERFIPGEVVEFCGQIADEASLDSVEMVLSSSVDDVLWTGEPRVDCEGGNIGLSLELSDDVHVLTLSATDARGQATVTAVTVVPSDNTPPWCSIESPLDGDSIEVGDAFDVAVTALDDEQDPSTLEVLVASDLDGELWAGSPDSSGAIGFAWTPQETGDHRVEVTVQDPRGLTDTCSGDVFVDPCLDEDADGVTTCDGDCDDGDETSYPGGEEVPDGADNDCDGDTDEGTVLGDDDGDGFTETDGDCDDADPQVNPDAEDIPYDGIDQDCSGADADDLDGDGYGDATDCDDTDADVNPGETETWYDGVDSDCSGGSDYDQDGDGYDSDAYGGTDCDDTSAAYNPAAVDTWYDGLDHDCDGADDYDQDGDGYRSDSYGGADCDDTDSGVNPGATETWYDGTDTDCDGADDYDQDGDGYRSDSYGGTDCDDTSADVNPGETETWYDGTDGDCSGGSDYDQDDDGYDHDSYGGTDCDDADADVNPGETETWYDGTDTDCSGGSDYDQDGDGDDHEDHGGGDCDDDDSAVHSSATETRDGKDNDCDASCDEGLLSAGDLIVSEVMQNPAAVTDSYGEWFEVYNTTAIDITICESWLFEDDDGDSFSLAGGYTVEVLAGDYAVLGRYDSTSVNGGVTVDYAYATGMQLANGSDELVLVHDGSEVDRIEWDDGATFPDPNGKSMTLDPTLLDATSNDDGGNWCSATSTYGDGDEGTPGSRNDGC